MDESEATATPTPTAPVTPADPGSTATPTPNTDPTPTPTVTVTVTPAPADGATLQDVATRLDQLHTDASTLLSLGLVVGMIIALGIGFIMTKGIRK